MWIVIGDTPNVMLVDIESNQKWTINSDCGLNRALVCSNNLIVTLSERMARVWDMNDFRLMHTIEVSHDTLSVQCIVDDYLFIGGCDLQVRWYNYSDIVTRYQTLLLMEDENTWQDEWNWKFNKKNKNKRKKKKKAQ